MNPVRSHPLMTGAVLLFGAVVFLLMVAIGFIVRDTNLESEREQRETRLHRIETRDNLIVLCRNQQRLGRELGLNGQLECPDPQVYDETGLSR